MNIKSVLRTYSLLRQLSDDETALLETLRQLNEGEREALVETLSPQPVKKAAKKSASKKSSRASSLERQIQKRGREVANGNDDDNNEARCTTVREDGRICFLLPDHNIHHLQSAMGYHEFDAGKPTTPTASDRSSANGGVGNSTANVGTSTDVATSAGSRG